VSPRSLEFFLTARERLASAIKLRDDGDTAPAISLAYYAMLFAVRAALSEEDLYAKTHSGLWGLFHQTFVATGRFPTELHKKAAATQKLRAAVDYEAEHPPETKADEVVAIAQQFVDAVAELIRSDA
jgi:uncharacterized protein (UPF0332 family)